MTSPSNTGRKPIRLVLSSIDFNNQLNLQTKPVNLLNPDVVYDISCEVYIEDSTAEFDLILEEFDEKCLCLY